MTARPGGQPSSCSPLPLPGAELIEWIALRRVNGGGVARLCRRWFDFGRSVPCYLPDTLDDLRDRALIALVDLEGCVGLRRAVMTRAGSLRYVELSARRGAPIVPPTGRFARGWSGQCPVPPSPGSRRWHGAAGEVAP